MPYGEKLVSDETVIDPPKGRAGGKPSKGGRTIDFDDVYRHLIEETIMGMEIECIRCDKINESGPILAKMIKQIYEADVAIVDITAFNPNVFYELGIRHALTKNVTVLVALAGTKRPFNIQDLKVIEYREEMDAIAKTKQTIATIIRNGLKSSEPDSPVHHILKLKINEEATAIPKQHIYRYALRSVRGKEIRLITGDLQHITEKIDVWVSSENTNMQMSRHYEGSISAVIRFMGAKRQAGDVVDDLVANELAEVLKSKRGVAPGSIAHVSAGTVLATGAGELARRGVKKIFHAAAVAGQVGHGYRPIANIEACVRNALDEADSEEHEASNLKSILFPLMGTGTGRGAVDEIAIKLIRAAISHLEANPAHRIQQVYFLVWSEKELRACQRVLHQFSNDVEPLDDSKTAT